VLHNLLLGHKFKDKNIYALCAKYSQNIGLNNLGRDSFEDVDIRGRKYERNFKGVRKVQECTMISTGLGTSGVLSVVMNLLLV
jgi:hypothetical protein